MSLFYYLLEVNLYVMVFYGLYKVLFERNTFYQLNRCFLVGSLLISFLIPLVDLSGLFVSASTVPAGGVAGPAERSMLPLVFTGVYLLGVLIMLVRFGLRLKALFSLLKKGELIPAQGFKLVLVNELEQAFSFMNFLFVNSRLKESEVILLHEQVHIRQRHSLDLLFLDLVQAVSWFNPLVSFIRCDLKILHEYLADEQTTDSVDAREYALFLIKNTYGFQPDHLGSYMFNQSNLKKRIMKLSQKKTGSGARLRYLIAAAMVPLMMAAASLSFARSFAVISIRPQATAVQDTVKTKKASAVPAKAMQAKAAGKEVKGKPPVMKTVKFPPPIVKKDAKASRPPKGTKTDNIKFPPPIVSPANKVSNQELPPPPPPPVDPSRKGKKSSADEVAPPPPPVEPRKTGELPPPPPVKKN